MLNTRNLLFWGEFFIAHILRQEQIFEASNFRGKKFNFSSSSRKLEIWKLRYLTKCISGNTLWGLNGGSLVVTFIHSVSVNHSGSYSGERRSIVRPGCNGTFVNPLANPVWGIDGCMLCYVYTLYKVEWKESNVTQFLEHTAWLLGKVLFCIGAPRPAIKYMDKQPNYHNWLQQANTEPRQATISLNKVG